MYYEIYMDQLFLENLLIMVLVLRTWGKMQNIPLGWKKIWCISVMGAVAVCAVIFFRPEKGMEAEITAWAVFLVLIGLTAGRTFFRKRKRSFRRREKNAECKSRQKGVWVFLSFFGIMAFYGGALQMIFTIWEPPILLAAVLVYMAAELLVDRQRKCMVLGECRAEITLEDQGNRWELTGFIDTGNHLTEPLTGRPVSILNRQEAEKMTRFCKILQEENGYLYIPFHSLGTNNGWMMGMVIDAMVVRYQGGEVRIGHPVLAVSREAVSMDGQYQMILNPLHILGTTSK